MVKSKLIFITLAIEIIVANADKGKHTTNVLNTI